MAVEVTSILLQLGFFFLSITSTVSAACHFPKRLQGSWQPAECSSLLVSSDLWCHIEVGETSVSGMAIADGTSLRFDCLMQDGNRFALRSQVTSLLSYPVRIYICWEFTEVDGSILVQQHTNQVSRSSPKRGKAFLTDYSPDIFECCDVDSSTPSFFQLHPVYQESF